MNLNMIWIRRQTGSYINPLAIADLRVERDRPWEAMHRATLEERDERWMLIALVSVGKPLVLVAYTHPDAELILRSVGRRLIARLTGASDVVGTGDNPNLIHMATLLDHATDDYRANRVDLVDPADKDERGEA